MSKAKSFSAVAGGLIICFSSMLVADENKTETKNGSSKNPLSISPEMLPNLSPEMQLMLLLNTMPHKPEWIELRKKLEDMNDKAMKTPVKKYTYQSSTTPVTIGGRIDLPTIVMRPGAFTSVSFVDAYGNPWDILSAQPSNQLVTVIKDEDGAISHNMLLVINEDYIESDLALFLKCGIIFSVNNLILFMQCSCFTPGKLDQTCRFCKFNTDFSSLIFSITYSGVPKSILRL